MLHFDRKKRRKIHLFMCLFEELSSKQMSIMQIHTHKHTNIPKLLN